MNSSDFYVARDRWLARLLAGRDTRSPGAATSVAINLALMARPDQPYAWSAGDPLAEMTPRKRNHTAVEEVQS